MWVGHLYNRDSWVCLNAKIKVDLSVMGASHNLALLSNAVLFHSDPPLRASRCPVTTWHEPKSLFSTLFPGSTKSHPTNETNLDWVSVSYWKFLSIWSTGWPLSSSTSSPSKGFSFVSAQPRTTITISLVLSPWKPLLMSQIQGSSCWKTASFLPAHSNAYSCFSSSSSSKISSLLTLPPRVLTPYIV